ncbi:MAG: carboxypeptidase-like regulatory domain-containing protein [Panacibacter sp.]
MTERNSHINYTLEDIERYLNGGMNAKEMHDMEKAALQDPFLSDAIEGYSEASIQQSQQNLNEITALLQKDKEEAKVVPLPAGSFQWWRVAAMIIVLVGVGIFSWYIIGNNNNAGNAKEVASAKENIAPVTADTNTSYGTITNADTITYIAQSRTEAPKALDKREAELSTHGETAAKLMTAADSNADGLYDKADDSVHTLAALTPGIEMSSADTVVKKIFTPLQGRGAGVMNNIAANNFSGFVLDNNKQPIPNALVNAGRLKRVAFTDKNGYFILQSPDSALQVSVSSVGFETTNVDLAQGYANNIVIAPDNQSLSEVVVTGYGNKKKESFAYPRADTTFPAGGWESFQEYVYRKMNRPYDSTTGSYATVHGDVEIEFDVNKDGDPYNFKILRSLGKAADEQAINALKDGPRWITSKRNKKGKVVITF